MRTVALLLLAGAAFAQPKFEISWPKAADGRVVLILAASANPEPRMTPGEGLNTSQIFGVDVDNARSAVVDKSTLGYPRDNFSQIPAGDYYVQAVLNLYET